MSKMFGNDAEGHETIHSNANQKGQKTAWLTNRPQVENTVGESGHSKDPEQNLRCRQGRTCCQIKATN